MRMGINQRSLLKRGLTIPAGMTVPGYLDGVVYDARAERRKTESFEMPLRQVHLDFHTSERIAGIGEKFDPEEFATTLARARVNSVTCFARCHHGYICYDTRLFPERHHPHLKRNFLKEQSEACHRRGIRVPVYTAIQWDQFTA